MKNNKTIDNTDIKLLAGQKLMVGFDGTEFNTDLEFLISKLKVGGLVLFSRNIESPVQLKTLLEKIIKFSLKQQLPKLFISIDQEGGEVARLKKPFTTFKGNPFIKNKNDAENFAKTQAIELDGLNINMNFAPVLDVVPRDYKSIMEKRAFKGSAETVATLGSNVIKTMQNHNVMAVAKHFPGIGRTYIDSHFELPIVNRNMEQMLKEELIPFEKAINSDVSGIMLSHILYPNLDSKWQASLSPKISRDLLRDKMNFKGLIMTDDLDMKSISHNIKTSAKQILLSDIDIVLICHKGPDIENMHKELINLIKDNNDFLECAKKSFKRIIETKEQYL
ncbi:MAG: glycoside hydrolase family 3 protein [Desulfobacteraceae bacterium]|nr:glycoside hydrolase family 3 protein [Desulfobacteraceae bacterium]